MTPILQQDCRQHAGRLTRFHSGLTPTCTALARHKREEVPIELVYPDLGTPSSRAQTLRWREMDSNYWSPQGRIPVWARHIVSGPLRPPSAKFPRETDSLVDSNLRFRNSRHTAQDRPDGTVHDGARTWTDSFVKAACR